MKLLNWINLASYVFNAVVTFGVGTGLFGGSLPSNAELSAKYTTLITPIGWAFSIWGLIFLAQLVWVVWQIIVALRGRRNEANNNDTAEQAINAVGYNYLFVCIAQAAWTFAFSLEVIWLSVVFMFLILAFLWKIVQSVNVENIKTYMVWKFPFSIHYAWILAAFAVNVSVLLVALQASATVQFWVAVASLIILLFLALYYLMQRDPDFTLPTVIGWALLGIYVALTAPAESITETFTERQIRGTQNATIIGATLILSGVVSSIVFLLIQKRRGRRGGSSEESSYLRAE